MPYPGLLRAATSACSAGFPPRRQRGAALWRAGRIEMPWPNKGQRIHLADRVGRVGM